MPDSDVPAAELESRLSAELGETVTETEVLHDGLNLTVGVSTEDGEDRYALRRPNKLRHTDLFNSLDREYRLLERLRPTAVRAPEPVLFCDDESILGDAFLVTTYLDGAAIPLGSGLPERFRTPDSRRRVAELLTDSLARIHSLDPEPFADCEPTSPREQVVQATARLDEATSVTGREFPTLRSVGDWLRDAAPSDPETALVHGDFRPGNVLFAGSERPEITGVLDWETAMVGDPRTELGYLLLRWRDDGDPTPSLDDVEARYPDADAIEQLREVNEAGLAPFTNGRGSPSRRELVARYEEATGISFEDARFYLAHAAFMLATVWEDLDRHQVEAGAEPDRGPHVAYLSALADSIVAGEFEL